MKHCSQPLKWFFATLLLSILISVSPNPSAADSFEDARDAYKQKDYKTAIEKLKPLAERGDAKAQGMIGHMYNSGKGVPKDYAEAVKWWRKAAEQGNSGAQMSLGVMYLLGDGVPQDYAEAVKWYKKAAEQGIALSQYNLGDMYSSGAGVLQDYKEAVKWYKKAAEQGVVDAQLSLGGMYDLGRGVPQDYVEAHKWYNLAAFLFPPGDNQKNARKLRDITERKMTPAQVAEAQKRAREWKPKPHKSPSVNVSSQDDASHIQKEKNENADGSTSEDTTQTILSLARQMDNGSPEAKDKLREFRKLALSPSTEADSIFTIFQAFGKIVDEGWEQHPEIERSGDSMMTPGVTLFSKRIGDTEKNLDLLIKEAFLLKMLAQEILFRFYVEIASVSNKPQFWDRYRPKILNLFTEGAEDGIPRFRYFLAKTYYHGLGVAKDEEIAISLLIDNTIEKALKLLVNIYLKRGQQDLAVNVLRNAGGLGFAFGPYNLGVLSRGKGEYKLAVQYWEKALELDPKYWEAKLNLAQAYGAGQGVNKNEAKAFKLMKEAVDEGNPDNKYVMAAQYQVGVYYLEGIVIEKSVNNAVKYFSLAAENGDSEAQFKLGNLYTRGREVPRDFNKAFMWLRKAAEQNLAKAQYNLGILYINGQGVQEDYNEGIRWVQKAADQGFAPAKRALESNSKK